MFGRVYKRLVAPACLLAGALVCSTVFTSGCETGPKLAKLETPAAGVTLAYDLAPGTTYVGQIERSETINSRGGGSVNRSIKFTAHLAVLGPDDEHGGTKVMAKLKNIDLNWALPPEIAAVVNISDLVSQARQQLENVEISFNVDATGKLLYIPPLPDGVSQELGMVIQQVLDALESAFYTVPDRALKPGEQWQDEKKRGRKGKLGRYIEGTVATTFEGLYAAAITGTPVARLVSKTEENEVTTTKSGSHEVRRQGESVMMFATDDGYLISNDSELRTFDAGNSTTFTNVTVIWNKTGKQPQQPSVVTQTIDDPCHPDYVGAGECVEQPVVPEGAESQSIDDPCNPDYVGPEECSSETTEATAEAGEAPTP